MNRTNNLIIMNEDVMEFLIINELWCYWHKHMLTNYGNLNLIKIKIFTQTLVNKQYLVIDHILHLLLLSYMLKSMLIVQTISDTNKGLIISLISF